MTYIFTVRDCDDMVAYEDESRIMADVVAREFAEKYPQFAPYTVHFERVTRNDDPRGE